MNREDFSMLRNTDIIYFDNNATTLKPDCVVKEITDYYTKYTANAHRGDYKTSHKVDTLYEDARDVVKNYINASDSKEIVFTYGSTDSINLVAESFFKNKLQKGDEVIITKTEHASIVLPFMKLAKEIGIKLIYAPLDDDLNLTIDGLKSVISSKTKAIALAHVTNTIGDIRDLDKIGSLCEKNNIYFLVDAAQSIGHKKIDVRKSNIDFLAFSGHKMLGPTGVGVLYGKYDYLKEMEPTRVGGGMNTFFEEDSFEYKLPPHKFEAGTPNIEGVIGLRRAILYINEIGLDQIAKHEEDLKEYLIEKLKRLDNINVINPNSQSGNILFNIEGIFPQDTAVYLDHYNICVRAGNHCAKLLKDELGTKNTCRISLYLYNTKEEIDKLIEVLENSKNIFEVVI